ncbi:unnamed protein product [Effrenium voratum]|nr:unnamed protein product [Effrenium voratum]
MSKEVWQKAIDLILAQEAEKAEILLRRVIRHLYSHESRFDVVDMDEGASFKLTKQLRRADTKKEEDERFAAMSDSRHKDDGELRVSDVLHIKLTLDNLLDYAKAARGGVLQQMEEEAKTSRFTFFGTRVVKRMLCYSWALMLLLCRFSITVCAMVMPRDEGTLVPLAYMILKLSYILMMATLQPYVWSYLNDWEIVVHSLIFMFMMFVISDWSAMASDVLLVVATWAAIVPVLLRIFVICTIKEAPHDPDEIHVKQDVSYHLEQLHGGPAQHQMGLSFGSMAVSRAMQHVKKSIDVVERRQVTVVEKTYDERGYPVERTIVTQEEDMEHAEYTLDVQKDEVAFMLHGEEGDEPRPPSLEPLGEEDRQESDVYDIKL